MVKRTRTKHLSKTSSSEQTRTATQTSGPSTPRDIDHGWSTYIPAEQWEKPVFLTKAELHTAEREWYPDKVTHFVKFWLRNIEAAEKGEEVKLTDLVEEQFQRELNSSWGLVPGWDYQHSAGMGAHGFKFEVESGAEPERKVKRGSRWGEDVDDDDYAFVESVARQRGLVDDKGRYELHAFYKLPTQVKVQKINEVIQEWRLANEDS